MIDKNDKSTIKSNSINDKKTAPDKSESKDSELPIGIALGLCIGVALGAVYNNIGIGTALGVCIGAFMGHLIKSRKN